MQTQDKDWGVGKLMQTVGSQQCAGDKMGFGHRTAEDGLQDDVAASTGISESTCYVPLSDRTHASGATMHPVAASKTCTR